MNILSWFFTNLLESNILFYSKFTHIKSLFKNQFLIDTELKKALPKKSWEPKTAVRPEFLWCTRQGISLQCGEVGRQAVSSYCQLASFIQLTKVSIFTVKTITSDVIPLFQKTVFSQNLICVLYALQSQIYLDFFFT